MEKNAKVCDVKILKNIPLNLETIETYCQTLEEVPRLLRLIKPKKHAKNFQKIEKNARFTKKMWTKFAISKH